jgi:mannose-1-phosphate guanylyltransferase/mannose-6-phosphate isomerase
MSKIVPVVLCGGSGTRLWPRSRKHKPKPFLPLIGERTMFEATLGRCGEPALFAPPVIVTGTAHLEHVEEQAAGTPGTSVIVEPQARNTAAAIALAAGRLPGDAIMLVCPSDHHIADVAAFRTAAAAAARLAAQDWLVAFGITATAPETGYGYIRRGEALEGGYRVERFVEKPDLATARGFLADGNYSWNGGIFAFRAGQFLAELEKHRPELARAAAASVAAGSEDGRRFHPGAAAFAAIEPESID